MGSKRKQTRELQKERIEQQLAKRRALLVEKGIDAQKIAKDKVVEHLLAEINKTVKAINSINAREKVIEKAKARSASGETAEGRYVLKESGSIFGQPEVGGDSS